MHKISIHALRGEGDHRKRHFFIASKTFQSTPSVGRATIKRTPNEKCTKFQSTPSVGRATKRKHENMKIYRLFQSTPSVGRATTGFRLSCFALLISIHALRGEGDQNQPLYGTRQKHISIHALRGEGDDIPDRAVPDSELFQSTPSVGRATRSPSCRMADRKISIHALRGEGDEQYAGNFAREAISIHALRGEGDDVEMRSILQADISIHALRGEGDLNKLIGIVPNSHFNPRPPWGGRRGAGCGKNSEKKLFQSTPSVGRATSLIRSIPMLI